MAKANNEPAIFPMHYRAFLKDLFYKVGLTGALDSLLYRVARFRYRKKNSTFRKANPSLPIPPDYFLYETYRLDYEKFFREGKEAANEVMDWTRNYLRQPPQRILDWGCGVSRVAPFIDQMALQGASVYACDINPAMVDFGRKHYKSITYEVIRYEPPTPWPDNYFDLIYAFSVFTHIQADKQKEWIADIHRILRNDGVFLFTTHGAYFQDKLLPREQDQLLTKGAFTKSFNQKGHRMMTTYNTADAFRGLLQTGFKVLEFHDGASDLSRAGGQDLWIVQKS